MVWTDGSVEEDQCNGGSGAIIVWKNNMPIEVNAPAGKWCSSYSAELQAVNIALENINADRRANNIKQITICLDNRGVITKLSGGPMKITSESEDKCWLLLKQLTSRGTHIVFQWVPSHVGIEHNELVDSTAKNATKLNQEGVKIDFSTIKARIKKTITRNWCTSKSRWKYNREAEKTLTREERSEVSRFRTGASLLVKHLPVQDWTNGQRYLRPM